MKEYIKIFYTPEEGDGYIINDVPWMATVASTHQNLLTDQEGMMVENRDGELIIISSETYFILLDGTKITFTGDTLMKEDISEFRGDLVSVVISPTVKNLVYSTFSNCEELSSVTIYNNSIKEISSYLFTNCPKLSHVILSDNIKTIEYQSFYNCYGLEAISIPNEVKEIKKQAFDGCSGLTEVIIGNGVTTIESGAFSNCTSLSYINIPSGVTSIASDAFYNCTSLPIDGDISYADTYLIEAVDKNFYSYTIKNGTRWIGRLAFMDCRNLTNITLPNSVEYIYEYAFENAGISEIFLSENIKEIRGRAFNTVDSVYITNLSAWCKIKMENSPFNGHVLYVNNEPLYSLVIPYDITVIKKHTFENVELLSSVTIHSGVTKIENYAFRGCEDLSDINIPSSVMSIGGSAFYGCSGFDEENSIRYADTFLIEAVDKTLSQYTLKNGVRFIGDYAFANCTNLFTFTIPNTVVEIGEHVFGGCTSLPSEGDLIYAGEYLVGVSGDVQTQYTVKNGTTWIGKNAFYTNSMIEYVYLPSTIKVIDDYAFYNCSSLTAVTISNGVERIGSHSFHEINSSLGIEELIIPPSVVEIGEDAFVDVFGVVISKLYPFKNRIFNCQENTKMSVAFLSVDESTFEGDFNVSSLFKTGSIPFWGKMINNEYDIYTDNSTIIQQLTEAAEETGTIFNFYDLNELPAY